MTREEKEILEKVTECFYRQEELANLTEDEKNEVEKRINKRSKLKGFARRRKYKNNPRDFPVIKIKKGRD